VKKTAYVRIVLWLIALNILALVGYAIIHSRNSNAKDQALRELAAKMEKEKVMPKDDYYRETIVGEQASNTGKVTDEDLKWLITQLNAKPMDPLLNFHLKNKVLTIFTALKDPSPAQREQIYSATVPFLSANDPSDQTFHINKQEAIKVMMVLQDKRSVPYIVPLLKDDVSFVRISAKKALEVMGYAVPPTKS
jgi:hypothetical protein